MEVSIKSWSKYAAALDKCDRKAAAMISAWREKHPDRPINDLIDYAEKVVARYSEAAVTLAEAYIERIQVASHTAVRTVAADTLETADIAKAINGTLKFSDRPDILGQACGRLVKKAAADTILRTAEHTRAEFAWIPQGDSCAFCTMLASKGWQRVSKGSNVRAEHIHQNCQCTYSIRYSKSTVYKGYDPEAYRRQYYEADGDGEGGTPKARLNYMRRKYYAENADAINSAKREAYAMFKEEPTE